jgi:hypothetical protein
VSLHVKATSGVEVNSTQYTEASSTLNDITALPRAKDPAVPVSKGALARPTSGLGASTIKELAVTGNQTSAGATFSALTVYAYQEKPRNPNVGTADLLVEICKRNSNT